MDRWMDGQTDGWMDGQMDKWICTEITWQLCFPFQLLLPSPFGSSVGKPDLRENRDCHWLCFQPPGTSCSYHVSLAWTQKVEPSSILTPSLPARAFALCPFPHRKGLGGGKRREQLTEKQEDFISLFFQTSFSPSCCRLYLHRPKSLIT